MGRIGEWFRRTAGINISFPGEHSRSSVIIVLYDFTDPEVAKRNHLEPSLYLTLFPIILNPQKPIDPQLLHNYAADMRQKLNNDGLLPNDSNIGPPCRFQPIAYQPHTRRLLVKVDILNLNK